MKHYNMHVDKLRSIYFFPPSSCRPTTAARLAYHQRQNRPKAHAFRREAVWPVELCQDSQCFAVASHTICSYGLLYLLNVYDDSQLPFYVREFFTLNNNYSHYNCRTNSVADVCRLRILHAHWIQLRRWVYPPLRNTCTERTCGFCGFPSSEVWLRDPKWALPLRVTSYAGWLESGFPPRAHIHRVFGGSKYVCLCG